MGMVQVRHVPDEVHRALKARAAMEGVSLSEYLRAELERVASRPTAAELAKRLAEREPVGGEAPAQEVRRLRDAGA
jgi:plasmid stability protein